MSDQSDGPEGVPPADDTPPPPPPPSPPDPQPTYTPPPPPPPDPQPTYTPPPPPAPDPQPTYQQPTYEQPAYQQPPPAPPPRPTVWTRNRLILIALSAIVALIGALLFFVGRGDSAAAGEIFLQGSDVPGTATFTPNIASAPPAQKASTATTTPAPTQGPSSTQGNAEGLYGAQRDVPSCNADALITYLEANPNRARPWAGALGLNAADIRAFVSALTPVVLRVDTRVTDYGFADGRAVPRQSILQAGTAVLVDRTGVPRVRCASGNPLGEPSAVTSSPDYTGTRWPGFSPQTIVIVNPAPTTTTLVLIDIVTGAIFVRIPGSIVIIDIDRLPAGTILIVVEPGGPARITGANWPPGTVVTITFDNPAVTLGTATADGAGNIAADVRIPDNAAPGVHTVTISGGGFNVPQTVYVIPRAPTASVTRG